jgi:hypothetical protein
VRRGEREGMVALLKRAEHSDSDASACADRVLSDPKRYGY